jgi:hypothetical protein
MSSGHEGVADWQWQVVAAYGCHEKNEDHASTVGLYEKASAGRIAVRGQILCND